MTLVAEERAGSPEIVVSPEKPSARRSWWMAYTDNEGLAIALAKETVPDSFAGLPLSQYTLSHQGAGYWNIDAEYATREGRTEDRETGSGGSTFSFDTGGGTQHITQALAQTGWAGVADPADPAFGGNSSDIPIGLSDDSVEGADIQTPQFSFTVTHQLPGELMTRAYLGVLFNTTGKVNGIPWWIFAAGEVLLEGVSGSKKGLEDWELSFKFSASPNRVNIRIGETPDGKTLKVGFKGGWEYLWMQYGDADDAGASKRIKLPVAAYTAQVYEHAPFAALGLEPSLATLFR